MKKCIPALFNAFSILILCTLMLPNTVTAAPAAATASPEAVTGTGDVWNLYTNANFIADLALDGSTLWAASSGGLVEWDISTGTYVKYHPTTSPLTEMGVKAVWLNWGGKHWFGTNGAVNTFDGATWGTISNDRLLSINDMAKDAAGNLWFASGFYGIFKFNGSTWTNYTKDDGLASNTATTIAAEGNIIWVGTGGSGISRFDGTSWTTYKIGDLSSIDNTIHDIAIAPNGTKWFGSGNGMGGSGGGGGTLTSFDGTTWTTYTAENSDLISSYVFAVAVDSSNVVWAGTELGVSRFDGATWTSYTPADGLANRWVTSIFINGSEVWFGTLDGISRLVGSTWTTFRTTDRLPHNSLYTLGSQGKDVWFSGGDLFVINTLNRATKFDGTTWTDYFYGEGLDTPEVHAMAADAYGKMWFGGWGIFSFDGATWQKHVDPYGSGTTYAIAFDGALKWFYTRRSFSSSEWISRYDGVSWTAYTAADGAPLNVRSIAVDANHAVWFGSYTGVSKFDGTTWTNYTTTEGLVNNNVYAVVIDQAGNKWFGTDGGLSKFDGTTWTNYTTDTVLSDNNLRGLALDPLGNLWIATYGGGVMMYDGSLWTTYKTSNSGLAGNYVLDIAINADNHKWFHTTSGVSEFYTLPPALEINYSTGAPGSYFNVTGSYFLPGESIALEVNTVPLGSVPADSSGAFTVTLSTDQNTDPGFYLVTASPAGEKILPQSTDGAALVDQAAARVSFVLDVLAEVREQEGSFTELDIPDGIAWKSLFLPFTLR